MTGRETNGNYDAVASAAGYFSTAAMEPGARIVDRMLGLTDADVADISGLLLAQHNDSV